MDQQEANDIVDWSNDIEDAATKDPGVVPAAEYEGPGLEMKTFEDSGMELQYCPTYQMVGFFFTKPLQGIKFLFFSWIIVGKDVK
jgi:hypothetical protein